MSDQTRLKANKQARLKVKRIAKLNGKLMEAQLIDIIDAAYHKIAAKGEFPFDINEGE